MLILKNPSHQIIVPPSVGFPTPSVTDTFDRANSASLGASYGRWWNGDQNLGIESNQCEPSTSDYCDNYYNVAQYQNKDVAVTIDTLPPTNEIVYLGGRIQSAGLAGMDCYQLVYTNAATDTIRLDRVINSTETALQTWNQNLANGNGFGFRISGTGATVTIEVYVNTGSGWTLLGTYNDTNANRITATGYGGLGIGTANITTRLNNFIVGNS
jgi:hypothetical protein